MSISGTHAPEFDKLTPPPTSQKIHVWHTTILSGFHSSNQLSQLVLSSADGVQLNYGKSLNQNIAMFANLATANLPNPYVHCQYVNIDSEAASNTWLPLLFCFVIKVTDYRVVNILSYLVRVPNW
jgi:hypothetical protein